MKILKEKSREYKGNSYFKYKVNIPEGALNRANLKEGDELLVTSKPGELLLFTKNKKKQEFDGIRSKLYRECLREFPDARLEDIEVMKKYLAPKNGERILEIGAGSGLFSKFISDLLGDDGRLIVSDPSLGQLEEIKELGKKNIDLIQFVQFGSEKVNLEKEKVDAVWSFGAMHHMFKKSKSFDNLSRILKKGARVVIADVFSGSNLAKHFDDKVAKFCIVGHEVAFWSKEYADSICFLGGFTKPKFYDLNIQWKFKNKEDIGFFLYKLHGMTKTTPENCLKGAEEILGVQKKDGLYCLNWPMTLFITYKK
ncbi:MAG: methyltransferase domain-containing protein [Nanoarchaeota archaeon]|nr:methyltransferase domain-containing protein [Nanoarchaeota archaeon]MBU4086653.1 methyltransferase domain-containing protein [Nanoarchaeota archaeon]